MTRNQWIGVSTVAAMIVAALITGGATLLSDSDKSSVKNDCSTSAACAGGDIINESDR